MLAADDVAVYVHVLQQIPNDASITSDPLPVALVVGMLSLLHHTPEANARQHITHSIASHPNTSHHTTHHECDACRWMGLQRR